MVAQPGVELEAAFVHQLYTRFPQQLQHDLLPPYPPRDSLHVLPHPGSHEQPEHKPVHGVLVLVTEVHLFVELELKLRGRVAPSEVVGEAFARQPWHLRLQPLRYLSLPVLSAVLWVDNL